MIGKYDGEWLVNMMVTVTGEDDGDWVVNLTGEYDGQYDW